MSVPSRRLVSVVSALGLGLGTATGYYFVKKGSNVGDLETPAADGEAPRERRFVDKHRHLGKVLASWTTNFEPTVKWDNNWDRRDPKFMVKPPKDANDTAQKENYENKVKEATPKATRHLLFIRHGQYNLDGTTQDSQRYLTEIGREQTALTGKRLKELSHPYTKMVHSNMTRARESAEIIHKHIPHVPVTVDEMLQEGAPIPPEPPIGNWRSESEFYKEGARIEAGFRKNFYRADPKQEKDSYEIYVCHANVIRFFICRALQLPPEAWLRMSMYNGSVTWFSIRPSGRVSLRYHGDAGHMPPRLLTTN